MRPSVVAWDVGVADGYIDAASALLQRWLNGKDTAEPTANEKLHESTKSSNNGKLMAVAVAAGGGSGGNRHRIGVDTH